MGTSGRAKSTDFIRLTLGQHEVVVIVDQIAKGIHAVRFS